MSAKSDFIRAVVEEGITMARKYFGTGIEKEIPTKQIDAAKEKFKSNKKTATEKAKTEKKKKDAEKKKKDAERAKSKATEKGVRFKKKYDAQEGAGLASDTGGSVNVSRDIDAGRAGKFTRGSASYTNFIKDQLAMSPGERAKSAVRKDFLKEINRAVGDNNDEAAKKLRKALDTIEKRWESAAVKVTESARRKQSATMSGRKKPVDKYGKALKEAVEDGIIESEYTEGLTGPQMEQILKAARNARKPIGRRIAESGMEQAKIKPGDSAIGRRSGSRGMSSGIRAEDRASNKDPINKLAKGGMAKKRTGSTDYRKGGMVMSTSVKRKK